MSLYFSLLYIYDEMTDRNLPIFQIHMELYDNQIKFVPSLNEENHGFSNRVLSILSYIENMVDAVPHVVLVGLVNEVCMGSKNKVTRQIRCVEQRSCCYIHFCN